AALKIIPGMANVHKQYRKALSDQTARAELLTQVAIELNETLAIEEIIERVLRATAAKLAMTEVSIVLIDPRGI
ncbi:MAG: hypothetical protein HC893_16845, partial [Chloroflexaceae bacterium]|nr:hypothetical protein [Chloroflexaceae bacterium]